MKLNNSMCLHFVGIGGAGMSGIAWILLKKGFKISGSDIAENNMTRRLRENNARIFIGHSEDNVSNPDFVVVSSAIPADNPELVAAKNNNIPILHRAEVLSQILNSGYGIAISGTHGKTTTTSMAALLLERANLDPTIIIGGEVNDIGGNAKLGNSDYIVAEADESDGSFLHFHPSCAIVTNVEPEHLDYYGDYNEILSTFQRFLSQLKPDGIAILCKDDLGVRTIIPSIKAKIITYSAKEPDATLFANNIALNSTGSSFALYYNGKHLTDINLGVAGLHNILNSLAAIALSLELGISIETTKASMQIFHGAQRRFEIKGSSHGITVVDDYAHHPSEISAAINIASLCKKEQPGHIISIFQPHRYSRTLHLGKEFGKSFSSSDLVIITDVYSAGETPILGISGKIVYDSVLDSGHNNVVYIPSKDDVCDFVLDKIERGDLVLTIGAGDVWKVGEEILRRLRLEPITNSPVS